VAKDNVTRKLAAILAADVVGYSRLIRADEEGTLAALKGLREDIVDPKIAEHKGRIVKLMGDGMLVEFGSVVDAVRSAVEVQQAVAEHQATVPEDRRILFRIGVNLGDVVIDGEDIHGDGVNVAARIEALSEPGGVCVSDSVHGEVRDRLELVFEDMGAQDVKNIDRPIRTYRLLLDGETAGSVSAIGSRHYSWSAIAASALVLMAVVAGGWWWVSQPDPLEKKEPTVEAPKGPSLAVLPFRNLSGVARDGYIADGMTEALITSLSKVPGLFVIARNSTATFKGKPVGVQQVAKDLGVRYVLEGSIQKIGEKLRTSAKLTDTKFGNVLWAERYDSNFSDFFGLQDSVVKKVIVGLQVKLTDGDHARIMSRKTKSLDAWLLRVQAIAEGSKFTREGMYRARELYQAANKADPNWARPLAGIAWTHEWDARRGWSKSKEESIRIGMKLAQKAIDMDAGDPLGYQILGNFHSMIGNIDKGIALKEKAVELAPNNVGALAGLAWLLYRSGQAKRAVNLYRRARRVSPILPWWVHAGEGLASHLDGQHERAVRALKQSIKLNPKRADLHARLAAVHADVGNIDEAKKNVLIALKISPNMTVKRVIKLAGFQHEKMNVWYRKLLRTAGLPE
jgi:adenylate cyclase